jgi:eukaryotic-like serine/threonine-protein kinase
MLGRYRLLEQIGAGGMGVVYRAHDERMGRDVAIKLLVPGSIRSVVARHRVRNEAMALSRLSHPNIETIFEFDTEDECDFLVVELIEGVSLDQLLSRGPLPQTLAVSLTMQLLRGLAAAHEKGIVHRDLKPSNLRLTHDSFLKILDFGIADLGTEKDEKAHNLTTETHSTILTGTLAYMSPEQLRGSPPDARSDIYATGLVLYHMCVGRAPYTETGALLIDAILNRPVPQPIKLNSEISEPLQKIILKALEKDPKQRYQSSREMLRDLEVLDSAIASHHASRKFQLATVTLLVLILGLMIGLEHRRITGWVNRRLHPVPENKYVAVMPFRSVTNDDPAFDQGLTEAVAAKLMEITAAQPVQIVSPRELQAEHVVDASEAKTKLGVNLVITGSLQQLQNEMRVNVELVDAASLRLLRASDFNLPASNTLALQDEVIDRAVQMLEIEMHKGIGEHANGTTNSEAFTAFTRGMGFFHYETNPEDIDSAIAEFQHALKIDPGYAAAHAQMGMAYVLKYRDYKDAGLIELGRQECKTTADLDSHSPLASLCMGTVQLTIGEYENAAISFRSAVDQDPSNDEAYGSLALAYERLGRTVQAEDAYKQAIAARPKYAVGYDRLAIFYSHRARYDEAGQQLLKAVQLAPQVPGYWASLGGIYYLSGKYEDALGTLQHAVGLRPSYSAYTNLGNSYFALRRYSDAIAAFQQSVALSPKRIQAHGSLARAYYWEPSTRPLARQEYLRALDLIDEQLKVNPRDADLHLLAAQYSAMLGRKQDSLQFLDFSLHTGINDPETLYFAAIVHNQLGDAGRALEYLHKALRQGYSQSEIERTPELSSLLPELRASK